MPVRLDFAAPEIAEIAVLPLPFFLAHRFFCASDRRLLPTLLRVAGALAEAFSGAEATSLPSTSRNALTPLPAAAR